jgi:homotetrameric cytidine deaminase
VAAVALLDDGRWVPGVRLESASYSLTLSALQNAHTTVETAEDAPPLAALVLSRPARREERLYVDQLDASLHAVADDAWVRSAYARPQLLPVPTSPLPVPLDAPMDTEQSGIDMARRAAARAVVPASEFPVGAVFETEAGHLVPGANVEHSDWARILCAERNALGTVQSYALGPVKRGFLSCLEDAAGTPCGACRQWLAELASASHLWMDRHETSPERAAVSTLLPGSFRGRPLLDG